jgi:hypothetical protein
MNQVAETHVPNNKKNDSIKKIQIIKKKKNKKNKIKKKKIRYSLT